MLFKMFNLILSTDAFGKAQGVDSSLRFICVIFYTELAKRWMAFNKLSHAALWCETPVTSLMNTWELYIEVPKSLVCTNVQSYILKVMLTYNIVMLLYAFYFFHANLRLYFYWGHLSKKSLKDFLRMFSGIRLFDFDVGLLSYVYSNLFVLQFLFAKLSSC